MLKNRKFIALLLSVTMIFTLLFSSTVAFAEDDYTEEDTASDEELTDENAAAGTRSDLDGYKGLVAHWKFDGDLKDSAKFKNDGQAVGGKSGVTFVDAVLGKGVRLDGKSYIEVQDSDSLALSNQFTFSFWVYKEDMRKNESMDGGVPYIIKTNEEGYEYPYGVYEWWAMTPGITFADEDGAYDIHSQKQVDMQKWTMISVSYDGKTMKIYRDKEMVKSELKSVSLINSSYPLYIGFGHFMTVDNYFKGILDDMKIYNEALSYGEIEDLYDEAVAKGSGKNLINKPNKLVAYYKFEDNLKDLSGFKNDGVAVKANNFKYVDGIAGKAIKFSGASYIEVKDNDSLDLDRGFTFGAWVYKEKTQDIYPIFSKFGESFDKRGCSYQVLDWFGNGPRLSLADFESEGEISEFETNLENEVAEGKWYYFTATYNGKAEDDEDTNKDSNTVKLYINGKLAATEEFNGEISNSSGPLWIGGTNHNSESIYFKGIMDEFRIYNYALNPTQVQTLYGMKDGLEVASTDKKVVFSSLKPKQNIQLAVNLITHMYTAPSAKLADGKDELKKLNVTPKATYKSSNPKIATISKEGKITTVGKGKATITATYGKYSQSISIVVK